MQAACGQPQKELVHVHQQLHLHTRTASSPVCAQNSDVPRPAPQQPVLHSEAQIIAHSRNNSPANVHVLAFAGVTE